MRLKNTESWTKSLQERSNFSMRLHRFYFEEKIGANTSLEFSSAGTVHQLRNVFRLKKGDTLIVFDGSGSDFECKIAEMEKSRIILDVVSVSKSRFVPNGKLVLCAAIVKKDTFEWLVEKAVELGVTDIIPVVAERSEKKLLNESRLNKICVEASEQSGRGTVPVIHRIVNLNEAIKRDLKGELKEVSGMQALDCSYLAFHTEGESFKKADFTSKKQVNDQALFVFIGPEGGWSPQELEAFHKEGIAVACLGPQILRAETAVISALSVIEFA